MRSTRMLRGFTLMEIMIVMVFGLILYQLMIVFGATSLSIQEMDRTTQSARSELALARNRALSGKGGTSWGVRFATSTIIQFQGSSYATRNPAYDLATPLSLKMNVTGTREFVFTSPLGEPAQSGAVIFSTGDRTRSVSVNIYGMIELQ
jgi:prepilin-type N-terminal cleavage/methylation domain-containing protein